MAHVLERLPTGLVWQGSQLASPPGTTLTTGFATLDRALPGGGWPAGALIELLTERPGVGELALLLPLMQQKSEHWIAWIAPPLLPYAPALVAAGLPLQRLLLVQPSSPAETLWAIRQATASGSCALVLAWPARLDTAALRRLQLAAEESATPLFLFRALCTARHASPAPLRLGLSPTAQGLQIDILKRRGPPAAHPVHLVWQGGALAESDLPSLSSRQVLSDTRRLARAG